jgi:VWFA-related protein
MVRKFLVPFLIALLAVSPVFPATAQEKPAEPSSQEETFFEAIDVQVVNIEVFVTDKQGQRVSDLAREDFEVLEDGQPVEISNFFAVTAGGSELPGSDTPAPAAPSEEAPAAPVEIPLEQRLHLAVLVDNLTLTAENRNRLVQSIEQSVIPRLRPDDRALVAVIDGSAVRVTQSLTTDPAQLRAALQEALKSSPQGSSRLMDKREILSRIDSVGLVPPGGESQAGELNARMVEQLYYDIRSYATQRSQEARMSLGAVANFVDSLSGLPGRKAVLYVGGGLSVRPAEALYQTWQLKFGIASRTMGVDISASSLDGLREDLTDELKEMIEHANANRVTFYTVGEIEELSGVSASSRTSGNWGVQMESLEKINLEQSLEMVAGGTGGLSGVGLSDPRNLFDRMRQDFDSYYSLGYVPVRHRDGKDRKIEVRVRDRQDLKVRHREGRRDQTNRERMTDRTLAALLLDAGGNPLEVAVDFLAEKKEKDNYMVEVLVKFPLAKLVLLPKERFHEGRVTLFIGARDSSGRTSPIQEIAVPIRVPNDQLLTALGQTAAYKTNLLLRPEAHTVGVSIRDELGNADSALAVEYTPGKK